MMQFNNDSESRTIGCASKTLSPTEQKYPQTQREALAMVWRVERFSMYLMGVNFTIRTDAESNEFIFGGLHRLGKRAVSRAEAWALRLQPYQFDVKRVTGENNIAGVLSRLVAQSETAKSFDDTNDKHLLYFLNVGELEITWDEIEIHAQNDEELNAVRLAVETGVWLSDNGPPFQSDKFVKTWEQKGITIRKSIPLSPQSNGAVERQNEGVKKALAASKLDNINWRMALEKYIHVHNKVSPLSRLGITPFELLVGWKYRDTFPCIWSAYPTITLDRENIKEKDAYSKQESKQYVDLKRGAKFSDLKLCLKS
ncbi:uncharacterized protein LOC131683016 [Topomyia yanbarensis]|uniref:uncharacterized protein LOC131683016 n=1 Tax=Topomyia yanbarensis TaxID=2498891 RepID=UPI00273B1606|nr:uncharacterized protein LOC131683016 [Topomyia yanbarensis]XP_058820827.1 uncharacterized protein LOC131683016 [Topomyia yanbarensis]XP_058820828.1 uncharacterized protein LOC131683016 [Topomyia yanbarensis]XP_058820829.1 uncharacterized protein LOC131683016 [Topomyia yanbarensis]